MADEKEGIISSTKPYSDALIVYSRASTIHGVYYIFEKGRWAVERILWGIVVIVAMVLAIYWSITAYNKWRDDPIMTTISTNGLPIQRIPFPSITICAQGINNLVQLSNIFLTQFKNYVLNTLYLSKSIITIF